MDFHNLPCTSYGGLSKNICEMSKQCGMHGSKGNFEQIFDGKWEGKSSFRRPV